MKQLSRKFVALITAAILVAVCGTNAFAEVIIDNARYHGYYHDAVNDEGVIGISVGQIYLNAFYDISGKYVRGICTTGLIDATRFSVSSTKIRTCDSLGNYSENTYINHFIAIGTVNTVSNVISITANAHSYVK
ncbi:MAG: hypothetical protein IJZ47_01085 [Oscillospiraceae bacterium]|nr:hypothetical protein [Oscillospiraceae bacterium]